MLLYGFICRVKTSINLCLLITWWYIYFLLFCCIIYCSPRSVFEGNEYPCMYNIHYGHITNVKTLAVVGHLLNSWTNFCDTDTFLSTLTLHCVEWINVCKSLVLQVTRDENVLHLGSWQSTLREHGNQDIGDYYKLYDTAILIA